MIRLAVCRNCARAFPPPAERCPVCGSVLALESREGSAQVVASTELLSPSEGWTSPHRLVLVELAGGGRLLAVAPGPLPAPGDPVRVVEREEGLFVLEPAPEVRSLLRSKRGEGELPPDGAFPPGL